MFVCRILYIMSLVTKALAIFNSRGQVSTVDICERGEVIC
ncbi:hypothetical protein LFUMFP_170019 [Latilactobacillus fuchuensis]|uniref:Uncharacterized protein n=1 Tax=Latilactobacillus fuchuensis TaxID=164393 RepID=A0A2N9DU44_9LACO|nr:hypothetical protein LFUMFP_170019 [Latilactobacillus fuchuensis]